MPFERGYTMFKKLATLFFVGFFTSNVAFSKHVQGHENGSEHPTGNGSSQSGNGSQK